MSRPTIRPTTRPPRPARQPVPAPAQPPLDRTLSYRLHQLHKLTDQCSAHAYPRQAGLSMSDGRCLASIGSFAPLSVKDLAQQAKLTKGQASRAAQALVDQGLVDKQDHPDDGRGVVLTLTEGGRVAWQRTMALIHQRNAQIVGCLGADEQATLSALLDRLIQHSLSHPRSAVDTRPQGAATNVPATPSKPATRLPRAGT